MKKIPRIIDCLESIETGRNITDLREAVFLRKFKKEYPENIKIVSRENVLETDPYFHAELTPRGKQHLKELRNNQIALPRLHKEIPSSRFVYSSNGRTELHGRGNND